MAEDAQAAEIVGRTPLPGLDARPKSVHFWPVFGWLALQMLALTMAGFRVPLSTHFPAPEERLAVHEMLVVQTVGAGMLFPVLCPTVATAVLVVASVPVMVLFAATMAGRPADGVVWGVGAYSTLWVAGLAVGSWGLRTPRARLYGVAGVLLVVLGGAVLAYLGREFGEPTQAFDWSARGWLGPLVGGMSLLEAGAGTGTAWAFLGLFLLAALLGAGGQWVWGRRRPLAP